MPPAGADSKAVDQENKRLTRSFEAEGLGSGGGEHHRQLLVSWPKAAISLSTCWLLLAGVYLYRSSLWGSGGGHGSTLLKADSNAEFQEKVTAQQLAELSLRMDNKTGDYQMCINYNWQVPDGFYLPCGAINLTEYGYDFVGGGICRASGNCACYPPWQWVSGVSATDVVTRCSKDPRCIGFAFDGYIGHLYFNQMYPDTLPGTCDAVSIDSAPCLPTWVCYSKNPDTCTWPMPEKSLVVYNWPSQQALCKCVQPLHGSELYKNLFSCQDQGQIYNSSCATNEICAAEGEWPLIERSETCKPACTTVACPAGMKHRRDAARTVVCGDCCVEEDVDPPTPEADEVKPPEPNLVCLNMTCPYGYKKKADSDTALFRPDIDELGVCCEEVDCYCLTPNTGANESASFECPDSELSQAGATRPMDPDSPEYALARLYKAKGQTCLNFPGGSWWHSARNMRVSIEAQYDTSNRVAIPVGLKDVVSCINVDGTGIVKVTKEGDRDFTSFNCGLGGPQNCRHSMTVIADLKRIDGTWAIGVTMQFAAGRYSAFKNDNGRFAPVTLGDTVIIPAGFANPKSAWPLSKRVFYSPDTSKFYSYCPWRSACTREGPWRISEKAAVCQEVCAGYACGDGHSLIDCADTTAAGGKQTCCKECQDVYVISQKASYLPPTSPKTPVFPLPKQLAGNGNKGKQIDCPHCQDNLVDIRTLLSTPNAVVPKPIATTASGPPPPFPATDLPDLWLQDGRKYIIRDSLAVNTLWIKSGSWLIFDDKPIVLKLRALVVLENSTLMMGGPSCPLVGPIKILLQGYSNYNVVKYWLDKAERLAGNNTRDQVKFYTNVVTRWMAEENQEHPEYTKSITIAGGTWSAYGVQFNPTWTRLAAPAYAKEIKIVLQDAVDWNPGMEILVVGTAWGGGQHEVMKIACVDGNVLTLEQPLKYNHYAGPDFQGEVGLLSRTITIEGELDDFSREHGIGGQTHCRNATMSRTPANNSKLNSGSDSPTCFVLGVAAVNLGQRNLIGRYPFHCHVLGRVAASRCTFKDNTIRGSFFRAVTIHGTHGARVENNVVYDVEGNSFYLEDGAEEDNWFKHNLVVKISPIKTAPTSRVPEETIPASRNIIVPTDATAAAFYCTNPNNRWVGNSVSDARVGYFFPYLPRQLGDAWDSGMFPRLSYVPGNQSTLQFVGNVFHSSNIHWGDRACVYVGGFLVDTFGRHDYNYTLTQEAYKPADKVLACQVRRLSWGPFSQVADGHGAKEDSSLVNTFVASAIVSRVKHWGQDGGGASSPLEPCDLETLAFKISGNRTIAAYGTCSDFECGDFHMRRDDLLIDPSWGLREIERRCCEETCALFNHQQVCKAVAFTVDSGPCTVDASGCAMSPKYPLHYLNLQSCTIGYRGPAAKIQVKEFDTEPSFDFLTITIDGTSVPYSGTGPPQPAGFPPLHLSPARSFTWTSDYSFTRGGWKLCLTEPAGAHLINLASDQAEKKVANSPGECCVKSCFSAEASSACEADAAGLVLRKSFAASKVLPVLPPLDLLQKDPDWAKETDTIEQSMRKACCQKDPLQTLFRTILTSPPGSGAAAAMSCRCMQPLLMDQWQAPADPRSVTSSFVCSGPLENLEGSCDNFAQANDPTSGLFLCSGIGGDGSPWPLSRIDEVCQRSCATMLGSAGNVEYKNFVCPNNQNLKPLAWARPSGIPRDVARVNGPDWETLFQAAAGRCCEAHRGFDYQVRQFLVTVLPNPETWRGTAAACSQCFRPEETNCLLLQERLELTQDDRSPPDSFNYTFRLIRGTGANLGQQCVYRTDRRDCTQTAVCDQTTARRVPPDCQWPDFFFKFTCPPNSIWRTAFAESQQMQMRPVTSRITNGR